ncbi:hypothetical protein BHYA_0015g00410 [Botrytis hyacinthi]|uniref:Uncharacterized protein n=1 Tax=Botrytis hyacinthi TaxID=278943 RepID=A0A4Z1GZE6_9HELO|nr:hypothetical protein BHYA_0015g00410 [Botrytis hyacinthi]
MANVTTDRHRRGTSGIVVDNSATELSVSVGIGTATTVNNEVEVDLKVVVGGWIAPETGTGFVTVIANNL